VDIVTEVETEDIPSRGKIILFVPKCSGRFQGLPWVPGTLYPVLKRVEREANHSYPPSVEVKNEWS
jgi:hypothetical protein